MRKAIREARKKYETFEKDRSRCMDLSGKVRAESKAAINFIVKGEVERGRKVMGPLPGMLKDMAGRIRKDPYLYSVPSLNEGLEEYVEAVLLLHYVEGKKQFPTPGTLGVNHEAYIGGLCDMTGELVRLARSRPERAERLYADVSSIYDQCIQMYVKRNNRIRSKLHDLERNLKKLEEILYERRNR